MSTRPGATDGAMRPRPVRTGHGPAGRPGAARQHSLRHHNLGLVLRHVLDAPVPVSRADVAAATGLTRATVSALVDRLLAARMLAELEPVAPQRAGRPAVPLAAAHGTVAAVGMELNVDYLGIRAVDLGGRVMVERVERGDFRGSEPGPALDRLGALAGGVLAELSADGVRLAGTALALPGLVDSVTGPLRLAPNLGWRDVDVVGLLSKHPVLAGLPPRLANEANLAALAEARVLRGGPHSFVYVSGEVGVGGAIVLDGEIFAGSHGWSGEIGHVVLGGVDEEADGGTLETFAGQDAILTRAGLPLSTTPAALVARAHAGDPAATEALARAGRALGLVLAGVVNVVDVETVVLGGIYADLADVLRPHVLDQLRRRVISAPWSSVDVVVAAAGSYPALTGAALSVLGPVITDPAEWLGEDPAPVLD